jgi:hypothetical protein
MLARFAAAGAACSVIALFLACSDSPSCSDKAIVGRLRSAGDDPRNPYCTASAEWGCSDNHRYGASCAGGGGLSCYCSIDEAIHKFGSADQACADTCCPVDPATDPASKVDACGACIAAACGYPY